MNPALAGSSFRRRQVVELDPGAGLMSIRPVCHNECNDG